MLCSIETLCRRFLWSGSLVASRRALVSWEKICLPKHAGGLSLFDIKIRNQAALGKLLWALSLKKDELWVLWVHNYYIKNQDVLLMDAPNQAWMIKVFSMRKHVPLLGDWFNVVKNGKFSIKAAYIRLKGVVEDVAWKNIIISIPAPQTVLITCACLWGKLRTKDILFGWNVITMQQ